MDIDAIELSEYGKASSRPSPVSRMMAAFAADFRDRIDINLGVGYVNENTIPRQAVQQALAAVLADPAKYRAALNYGGPNGSPNLLDAVRRYLLRGGNGLTEDLLGRREIIIGPNGATSLLDGLARLLPPGIVLTSDPIYYIYCDVLERMGFEVLAVPEDREGLDVGRLERQLRRLGQRKRHVRFLYVVTVNNPTGTILSNRRRKEIVDLAARLSAELGRKVPLVLDKAYEDLIHNPDAETPRSGLTFDAAEIVYEVGTLSKILAPALRVGYMIGPPGNLMKALVQRTSDAGFSAPLVTQEMAAWLLDHCVADQVARVNAGYREKAVRTRRWIDAELGAYLSDVRGGSAGFYYYLTFERIATGEQSDFFRFLARTTGHAEIDGPAGDKGPRVVYIPGHFCVHGRGEMAEAGRRQLRLSYGFEELPRIEQAIGLMREAAQYATRRQDRSSRGARQA